jgi:hypothetical protein
LLCKELKIVLMADSNIAVMKELKKELTSAVSDRDSRLITIREIAVNVAFFKNNLPIISTHEQRIAFENEVKRLMEVYKQRKTIRLMSSRGNISNELEFNWSIRFYCSNRGVLLKKLAFVEKKVALVKNDLR